MPTKSAFRDISTPVTWELGIAAGDIHIAHG